MGDVVLTVALLVEAAFATYCIVTRSNQWRVRNFIRIGAWAAFVLLAAVSVIRWSIVWVGLAVLLTIWAALGAWGLVRKQTQARTYKPVPVIGRAIGTLLLVCLVIVPLLIMPQHKPVAVTGPHPVGTVTFTYIDPKRIETFNDTGAHRQVNVEFWYPQDGSGKYPLVIFSHGSLGTKLQNASTFTELASNGYVVCSIDHPYVAMFTMGTDRKPVMYSPAFYQELVDANSGKYDAATEYQVEQKWLRLQADDIHFVLDTVLAQARDPEAQGVYPLIDAGQKVGLMGHSLGGEAAALVARERNDVGAVVNLDADLAGEYVSFTDGKEVMNDTPYPVPLLSILADDVVRLIDKIPDAQTTVAVEHVSATAPHAYLVHIKGTDHMSVTNVPIVSPFLASMLVNSVKKAGGGASADKYYVIETVNHLALTFFNTYIKGQGSFTPAKTY